MQNSYDSLGLTTAVALEKLKTTGANELQRQKSKSKSRLILDQFKSPLVLILIFACLISFLLGEAIEAVAIAAILVVNALIGFFQEYRAETAIQALQNMTAPRAKVLRDSYQQIILARDVVPKDILFLEAGDIVAADAKILEASRLQVNESVLTGESLPVEKTSDEKSLSNIQDSKHLGEQVGKVFMGTTVTAGTAKVIVQATGMKTELGKIAHLIASVEDEETPLQMQLNWVGKILLWVCLAIVLLVALIGIFQGRPFLELMIFSVSLAVAAVPEGMPAIVTVAMALGVQRLAKRNALIRKLPSVETLGSVSVICTDKTGTLTTGSMRIREIWGEDHDQIILTAASCCDSELDAIGAGGVGDPTEIAILIEARSRSFTKEKIEADNPRLFTVPFDAENRYMAIYRNDQVNYVKGGIEAILDKLSSSSKEKIQSIHEASQEMSERGLRVLAIAKTSSKEVCDLDFVGLVGIADPPRVEAIEAIRVARKAGIKPVMITGDHPVTANAIAREMGLILEGEVAKNSVHARATPEEKLKLVREFKQQGQIVAMTGDGVNDAPALRESHIGIAMGVTGTEVTRQAADLVLADDNFATIIAAVKEGRGIFENIRKAVSYLLIGNLAEIIIVLGAVLLGLPLPLLAAHLLWINLVTDALPALTLIAEPASEDLMRRKPRAITEKILGSRQWISILIVGFIEASLVLSVYYVLLNRYEEGYARNIAFTLIVCSQVFRAFSARSFERLLFQVGIFTNLWLLAVAILTVLLQLSLHFIPLGQKIFGLSPLSMQDMIFVLTLSLITTTLIEIKKIIMKFINFKSEG